MLNKAIFTAQILATIAVAWVYLYFMIAVWW